MRGRRVFVTGLGFVSPHGEDPAQVFDRIFRGESAVRMVRSGTPELGADVLLASIDFEPGDRLGKLDRLFMARAAQMAVVATRNALEDSGLLLEGGGPEEAGVSTGCGLGGAEILQQTYGAYFKRNTRRARPTTVPLIMASGPASHVSMKFGLRGPAHTYSIACASSSVAIGEAFRSIRDGYSEVILVGGAEAMLTDGSIAAWQGAGVIAKEHADVAFGYGVEMQQTFPKRMEAQLEARRSTARTAGATHIEVLNLGVSGYNPYTEAALLADVGPSYQPDLVLVQFCINDLNDPTLHFNVQARLHMGTIPDAAYPEPSIVIEPESTS